MTNIQTMVNNILIATPALTETPFKQAVVYVCEHHDSGTIGLMINRPMQYQLGIVFDQLHITPVREELSKKPLLFGGPLQPERGFVIHKQMGKWQSSLTLRDDVTITTSNDIIHALATNNEPKDSIITLGYMGWADNQLEEEIMNNVWLIVPYSQELMYEVPFDQRWEYAGLSIGVHMNQMIAGEGHA